MPELTALHLTDTHENVQQIRAAVAIAEAENIDVVWHTGDFVGKNNTSGNSKPTLEEIIPHELQRISENSANLQKVQAIAEKYGQIQSIEDIADESEREEFVAAYQAHTQELQQAVVGAAVHAYEELKPELQKLASRAKIVGVLGNHDLKIGYKLFSDIVDFAELKSEVKVTGKTGKTFTVKGALNTFEMPRTFSDQSIQQILGPYYIDYLSGYNSDDPQMASNPQFQEAVKKANEKELSRLRQTGDADVFLLHKAPGSYMGDGGEHAIEYSKQAKSIVSGHGHGGEIYKDKNGKMVFRPGSNHIFVYDYDANKNVEAVRIYRI